MGAVRTYDVAALVRASIDGDQDAWNELVTRYARLLTAIISQYRLPSADAQDVSQLVWLRLVEHLAYIRQPAALASWLATTTRHECQRYVRLNRRSLPIDPNALTDLLPLDGREIEESVLAAERHQVLRDALAELTDQDRNLLTMLASDPPVRYTEISRVLDIPIGSIGPTRGRALDRLRETAAVRAYLGAAGRSVRTGGARHAHAELE